LNSEIGKQILKHEMVHIEQKHTFDKIILEIITSVFWFNPFYHLIKKEINLIHEYLADKKAVRQSDTKAFAQMLLASHFSGTELPATSPVLSSNLKKRLTMLQNHRQNSGMREEFSLTGSVHSSVCLYGQCKEQRNSQDQS
jgi:beta-lactamase regulating signal transducer with metallopeptidase domain